MALGQQPRPFVSDTDFTFVGLRRFARFLPFIAIALAGVIGAAIVFRIAADADDARLRHELELHTWWRARDFERKLNAVASSAQAVAVLMALQEKPNAERFHQFAAQSNLGRPIDRILWAPRVASTVAANDKPAAEPGGDDYFPIELEHRFGDFASVEGSDFAAQAPLRAVMARSRDEARALSSPPLPLFGTGTVGYLVIWPIYQTGTVPEDVAERRARLRGFVAASFDLAAVLNSSIVDTPHLSEPIYFVPGKEAGLLAPAAVYSPDSGSITQGGDMPVAAAEGLIRLDRSFKVFGQPWTVVFDLDPSGLRSPMRWALPAGVLLLTAVLLAYLARKQGYQRRIEARVVERTADLRAANDALATEIETRQKTYEQLIQAQKMEAIGNLTGGLAHDSNNLLGIVMGNLELLRESGTLSRDGLELIDDALDATARGAELNRQLLGFARRQHLQPKQTEIGELVAGQFKLLRRTLGQQIEVSMMASPDLWPVIIDTAQLASTLTNLAINARDAMPGGGRLAIQAYNGHLDADYAGAHPEVVPGDYVIIEVTDTGTGISPEHLPRVFEPFYTTKPLGMGTGLGLSMVFGFIKQSNGHVCIDSEIDCGTTIRLYLPRADNADPEKDLPAAYPAWTPAASTAPPATVLAVEDDPQLRKVLTRQLQDLGYLVLEAENGQAALEFLRNCDQIDLLLTDVVMPGGVNGYALARQAIAERPALKVVFMSGFPEAAFGDGRALPETGLLLPKPFRQSELAAKLRQALLTREPA